MKDEIPQEVISLVDGKLVSSVDGEIKKPNLDNYWTKRLTHTYDGNGLNCKDITKEKRYSYINLCSDLVDHYDFVDSCWCNNLVPSMNFDIEESISCWIGFPNSNNECRLETIEDVLGFIKSNWEVK